MATASANEAETTLLKADTLLAMALGYPLEHVHARTGSATLGDLLRSSPDAIRVLARETNPMTRSWQGHWLKR